MSEELIAAVDMGSNGFRLVIGRVEEGQIYELDSLKEAVRLAAGLDENDMLDEASQDRGVAALRLFNERLRGFSPSAVRAVATNTLRVAKNASEFLTRGAQALGFPIEVISGREEARLIYVGVAHSLPEPERQQLVVDIGGGSTEFIIGRNFEALHLESLYMGCVSYSLRYFPKGELTRNAMKKAELAARQEMQGMVKAYRASGWDIAVGSSGSAKALSDVLELNGFSDRGITREGLEKLRHVMLEAGHIDKLSLSGLKADRLPVFAGGFCIMYGLFKELELERMTYSDGALRLGVLYDLFGRYHRDDLRDATVQAFVRRYQVDVSQAQRVGITAQKLFEQLSEKDDKDSAKENDMAARFLQWAAWLHEIGLSVAHASYNKHTAYIVANADMPGFSQADQERLARLVLGHRGKLEKMESTLAQCSDLRLVLCLRLAVILHRSREDRSDFPIHLSMSKQTYVALADEHWLEDSPMTAAALQEEQTQWEKINKSFRLKAERPSGHAKAEA